MKEDVADFILLSSLGVVNGLILILTTPVILGWVSPLEEFVQEYGAKGAYVAHSVMAVLSLAVLLFVVRKANIIARRNNW